MLHVPTDPKQANPDLPTVAIDLSAAYSSEKKGTGFATSGLNCTPSAFRNVTQTQALNQTLDFFKRVEETGIVSVNLILEAPLSWTFASTEPPNHLDARLREIEKPSSFPNLRLKPGKIRGWMVNAGASTSLVALLFLKELEPQIPKDLRVNLFEGFWSWVKKPKQHRDVAEGLLDGLKQGDRRIVSLPPSSICYRTALQFLGIPAENASVPPLVVFGHHDLAEAYVPTP